MRPSHRLRIGLILIAWLAGATAPRADDTWTLASFHDPVNDAQVRIAAVRNADGYGFKVYAPSHETHIWATFLLPPDGPEVFAAEPDLGWQVQGAAPDSAAAVTAAIAAGTGEDPGGLLHRGPRYIALVIAEAARADAAAPLRDLMAGGTLRVRYAAQDAGPRETAFTLTGADTAIAEVLALFER
jgi:hypothetical protein